jgi:hypothetical protein
VTTSDSAWGQFSAWIDAASGRVRVLPPDEARAQTVARALGVSERSSLWAMATNAGGLLIDDGWIRVLGGGTPGQRAELADWNGLSSAPTFVKHPALFVVGFDVLGGLFALDGGALGPGGGDVCYFAPDSLAWEPLGVGYTAWLEWLLVDARPLDSFAASLRWSTWRDDVRGLPLDTALSAWPFPWTKEGQAVEAVSRAAVPAAEVVALAFESARALDAKDVPGPRRAMR